MMMTKVWNDASWSDRDSAEAMIGGELRTLKITAIGRTRHGPKNVYYFSLFWSRLRLPRVNADANKFSWHLLHRGERTSLTCILILDVCYSIQLCRFHNLIIINAGHEYFTTILCTGT
uniref:Uncharacterized protein n=1 Tax=Schizaphis graminum TaxID=13262 RepID=A0A2S2NAD4_SCHGA